MHVNSFLKRHLSSFLIAGIIFFSVAFLFMKNDRELDPDYQKNWWTLDFSTLPTSENSSFIITNHTQTDRFTYTLKNGSVILETQEVRVPKGASRIIQPEYITEELDVIYPQDRREISAWPTDSPENIFSIYQK